MDAGLEMRIHDPLWLLARQWQFGEFQGEDTGSPVWAELGGVEMPINLYMPGSIEGCTPDDFEEYSPDTPLEYLVERERTPARLALAANRRLAVEAGQQFFRLLDSILIDTYRVNLLGAFGLKPLAAAERSGLDRDSLAFLDLMVGRALDGAQLLDAIQQASPADWATNLGFNTGDAPLANQAITAWKTWCEKMVGPVDPMAQSQNTWNPARMEYSCALAAPDESNAASIVLTASEYPGGHLDWYSFDKAIDKKVDPKLTLQSRKIECATLPTVLGFRGLPASRLWEFEDAQVRFGSITAAPTDLARMLLVEFLVQYGNDFFTIPVELDAGSLFHIRELKITNTFGDQTTVLPSSDEPWQMFALSSDSTMKSTSPSPMLFLPPVLGQDFTTPPIEDLRLLRDEMANIAWAVERVVESKCGKPLDRHEMYQVRRRKLGGDQQPASQQASLVYRLDTWQSSLPDFWIPLLPESPSPGQSPMRLVCHDPQNILSQGRLLSEHANGTSQYLFDDEVPRAGSRITRTQQYTRWYNGSLFAWIGREKRPGRGEGSSGLRNDIVEAVDKAQ